MELVVVETPGTAAEDPALCGDVTGGVIGIAERLESSPQDGDRLVSGEQVVFEPVPPAVITRAGVGEDARR